MTSPAISANAFRIVFSRKSYIILAAGSAFALWMLFNILDGLILLSPLLTFYLPIPADAFAGFILSILTASLASVVISMNVFLFFAGVKIRNVPFLSGSTLGTVSSVCASCSSVGFFLASTFGVAGVAVSSFLSTYQIPLRIVAIAILAVALISAQRKIAKACKISN